jgi:hypothetical protein
MKFFFIFLFLIFGWFTLWAEAKESFTLAATDPAQTKDSIVYDYIFLGSKYQNKFAFQGRSFGSDVPLLSTDLIVYFHSGFWMNASGFHFLDENIPFQTSLSAGYSFDISKKVDFTLAYAQFIFSNTQEVRGLGSQGLMQSQLGVDWNILYSTIGSQILFNENSDVFFNTTHSRYFEFENKLFNKVTVSFKPKFSLFFGTNRFDLAANFIENGNQEELEREARRIKPLAWEFEIPLTFRIGNFSVEAGNRYVRPLNLVEGDQSKPVLIHSLELYYSIPIKRVK